MRTFEDRPAVRENTPIMVGLVGCSGSGKTFSALRLATGFKRVNKGEIFMIDTEARRGLHYADRFQFRHVAFGAPFGSLDYLAAIEHCIAHGAGTIIIDSMSHEHAGVGGMLEFHEAEVERLSRGDAQRAEKIKMLAWQKPKQARTKLINHMLQVNCNFVCCFRAKEKIEMRPGKEPLQLGFMPIAGEEFVYELTLKCLLLPGANGIPTWTSEFSGERAMMKLPEQFREMFSRNPPPQLTEDIGERLAGWAAGSAPSKPKAPAELVAEYRSCSDPATLRALEDQRRRLWNDLSKADKAAMKEAADAAAARVAQADKPAVTVADRELTDEEKAAIEAEERNRGQ